jgi:high-affinity nickel permease
MTLTTALVTGAVLGVRHSLEADHLAAIATLVDDETTDDPGIVGACWGVGHALPIVPTVSCSPSSASSTARPTVGSWSSRSR